MEACRSKIEDRQPVETPSAACRPPLPRTGRRPGTVLTMAFAPYEDAWDGMGRGSRATASLRALLPQLCRATTGSRCCSARPLGPAVTARRLRRQQHRAAAAAAAAAVREGAYSDASADDASRSSDGGGGRGARGRPPRRRGGVCVRRRRHRRRGRRPAGGAARGRRDGGALATPADGRLRQRAAGVTRRRRRARACALASRYRVLSLLAEGSFARVVTAEDVAVVARAAPPAAPTPTAAFAAGSVDAGAAGRASSRSRSCARRLLRSACARRRVCAGSARSARARRRRRARRRAWPLAPAGAPSSPGRPCACRSAPRGLVARAGFVEPGGAGRRGRRWRRGAARARSRAPVGAPRRSAC